MSCCTAQAFRYISFQKLAALLNAFDLTTRQRLPKHQIERVPVRILVRAAERICSRHRFWEALVSDFLSERFIFEMSCNGYLSF